jgi:hypothetical protein
VCSTVEDMLSIRCAEIKFDVEELRKFSSPNITFVIKEKGEIGHARENMR